VYGPLVLEHKETGTTQILTESVNPTYVDEYPSGVDESELADIQKFIDEDNVIGPIKEASANKTKQDWNNSINKLDVEIYKCRQHLSYVTLAIQYVKSSHPADRDLQKKYKIWAGDLEQGRQVLDQRVSSWLSVKDEWKSNIRDLDNDANISKRDESDRNRQDKEDYNRGQEEERTQVQKDKLEFEKEVKRKEQEENDLSDAKSKHRSQAQAHGAYTIKDVPGISLQPTMSNVRVKIHYVGGPYGSEHGSGDTHDYQELAVGTKVVPMKVGNFANIQDAILDDYFADKSSMLFKQKSRSALRGIFRFVEKGVKKLSGKDVDLAKTVKDPAMRMILLSPQGFVNASAFKKDKGASSFYNFTSSSVVFRSDDMTYQGGENFFANRSQMREMFKAGWNTFVILKEIEETVYFISNLDGGQLHILPYSYMFNSLKMDGIYDSDEFKRRSKGFQMKSGNIGSLVNRLNRESKIYESVQRALDHE
jgi:hypothetical protein